MTNHEQQWQQLQQMRETRRLPHALLFKGAAGTGKQQFARHFLQALLCLQNKPDGSACDTCHGCRQVIGQAHPDMMLIGPEKLGAAIKIDQIRKLNEFVRQSSLQGGFRIAIIYPADAMNVNAANALLKTLEEPAPDALLILVSNLSGQLPATILSRCQYVRFPSAPQAPTEDEMALQAALEAALGSSHPDPLTLADKLKGDEMLPVVDGYIHWLAGVLRKKMLASENSTIPKLTALIDHAQQTRKLLCDGIHLNKQLMLEDLFIRWAQYANLPR